MTRGAMLGGVATLLFVAVLTSVPKVGMAQCSSMYQCTPAGASWSDHITTYPPDWYTFAGAEKLTPLEYIEQKSPCCRHCVWSVGYPLAIPAVIAVSPKQDTCHDPSSTGYSACYLDCTKWDGDFAIVDADSDSKLNATEMRSYFADRSIAPPQNYLLYTGGQSYSAELSRLHPDIVFKLCDLNKDQSISEDEWRVFRQFWSPTLVSRAGPGKVPEDGRPLADGPLGGFFVDRYFMNIWQVNMVNIMLEYYISNMNRGFQMIDVREPRSHEKEAILREMDLDGSGRVSIEESYFRVFADTDKDGQLSASEYYASLYKTDCTSLAAAPVAADCGGSGGNADSESLKRNFGSHDLDGNDKISFLERKFVTADLDYDRKIDAEEWRIGDFPEKYGPFEGHCAVYPGQSSECKLDQTRYNYYMSFHYCASQGSLAYARPLSASPWSSACELVVQVEESDPFVQVLTAAEKADSGKTELELEEEGWLCWEAAGEHPEMCFKGYAVATFHSVAQRLQWTYRLVLVPDGELLVDKHLTAPVLSNGADKAVFKLALFTGYQAPWDPPDKFSCSDALWREDGLVVVKRKADVTTSIELAILAMIIDPSFVNFVVFCYFVVLVMGHLFWFLESGENELFDKRFTVGVMDGLWFSMVTVTTVGYGDIVPVSSLGKALTVLWMFFGILCFGVFSGSVSDQINTSSAENSITGVNDLSTFRVGVLAMLAEPVVQGLNLGNDFNFDQVLCKDIAECEKLLVKDKSISAMIVPHSDIIKHFKATENGAQSCDKRMKVVGGNFSAESAARWTGATVKICSYSQSVYAARYLADAVSASFAELLQDGTADRLMEQQLSLGDEGEECGSAGGYNVQLIISTCVVVVFYFCLIELMRKYRKHLVDKRVLNNLNNAVDFGERTTLSPAMLEEKYGRRWLAKVRCAKMRRAKDKLAKLRAIGAHDHIMHMVKRLRNIFVQQAQEIRNINHDTRTARERVSRLMTFMSIVGVVLVVTLVAVTIAMVVVWGRLVRLTYL